jgi:hypothetical protein
MIFYLKHYISYSIYYAKRIFENADFYADVM